MNQDPIRKTLKEYGRGIIGGLLFSLPLLYTIEVWWRGFTADPLFLMSGLIGTYLLLVGYNHFSGLRNDYTFLGICWDSVEEIGLAVLVGFLFLFLIGKVDFTMPASEIIGKVVVEAMIVAIGISVGTQKLGKSNGNSSDSKGGDSKGDDSEKEGFFRIFILAACGAVLFSSSVAPTEEILMIAVESESRHLFLMVLLSLFMSLIVLYFVDFKKAYPQKHDYLTMGGKVLVGYVSALLMSFILLLFFGRVTGEGFSIVLAEVIVLGIPASLGASAGRVLIGR